MSPRHRSARPLLLLLAVLAACSREQAPPSVPVGPDADAAGHTAPTRTTADANRAVTTALPLGDPQDFADARRGLVGSEPEVVVTREGTDTVIWNSRDYGFVAGDAPESVNPSLWRQAQLNGIHGLFEVTDGVYQVRGYDLANLTLIRGTTGWIVVDVLTAKETAAAAMALARRHLGEVPVSAVVITHSHIDHFGGIDGVLPPGTSRDGIPIVAPLHFMEEATSENVLAGVAMGRRATYMYGSDLERTERGHVDTGLGKGPARGTIDIAAPTVIVDRTPQEMTIDGVRFVFQYVPDSEAPAELAFYLPDAKVYDGAEIVSHTMHNLYTLRGAKVRDALKWSGYIDDAIQRFPDAEIVMTSHHWPVWGRPRVRDHLEKQRDVYKFLHDQTLRMANGGATPREIAETLVLPPALAQNFATRGYYGTVRHNAKAVYQMYFGWYDGNPANLDPLPPVEEGTRMVAAMGGADAVRQRAQTAFDAGDYRWAATLLNHLVFAAPQDGAARALLARTYDQLGYQAESGPWRDEYLTAARELRHGPTADAVDLTTTIGLLRAVSIARFLDALAATVDATKAEGKRITVNFVFTDVGETHVLELSNSVLHHRQRDADPAADATVRLTHELFLRLVTKQAGLRETIFSDDLQVDGSKLSVLSLLSTLDRPDPRFAIVTP